jgi:D-alanyl-D-alanine carboxypeptidase
MVLVSGLLVIAAIAAGLGLAHLALPSSTAATPIDLLGSDQPGELSSTAAPSVDVARSDDRRALGETGGLVPGDTKVLRPEHRRALDRADGIVPNGTTVFDDDIPGVANLDQRLLKALRRAATDAVRDGVEFQVTSGWRSAEYQERLFRDAISDYGSEKEAARWVATPNTSPHVSGDAVDIGPSDATAWLSEHGARYGLCQIYRNEPWHYELRSGAIDDGCPRMYADPAHDPRMQQ